MEQTKIQLSKVIKEKKRIKLTGIKCDKQKQKKRVTEQSKLLFVT